MEFKLTSSQRNFYTKNTFLDSTIWNQGVYETFPKIYSYKQLNDAYNRLVEDNDSLRVKIKETADGPVTYVEDFEYVEWPFLKVDTEEELMAHFKEFINTPTDIYGRLVKCIVFQTSSTSGILISAHHMVIDGFSASVMSEDINNYLHDLNYKPPFRQSYLEFIEKEEKHKKSKRFLSDRQFWKEQFELNPVCDMFSSRSNKPNYDAKAINLEVPHEFVNEIKAFCKEQDISPSSFFNTVYATYIFRTLDLKKFTIGVPVLNRTTQAEINTIGLYMHVMPLVVDLQSSSFIENARKIDDSWMNIFRHQKFTQQDIKDMLREENPSFNTLFDFAADFLEFEPKEEYDVKFDYIDMLSMPLELHLLAFSKNPPVLKALYQTALFDEREINILLRSVIAIAKDALSNPDKNIYDLEMVSSEEKKKLLYDFNNTKAEYAKDKCIHELFEERVEKTPDKMALVANDKKLTYKELNEEANKLANSLIEKGIGKGDIVGIKLSRTSKFMVSVLGILKSGAAYLPFDPSHPQDRIEQILSDSNAKLCITEENFDELLNNTNTQNPDVKIAGNDLCYCIYTSGSTGVPKGAMIQHKNLCWYMSALMHIYGTDAINMPFFTSTSVDLSVPSYFLPLLTGGTTYFYDNDLLSDLNDIFNNEKINTIKATPTHLQIILQHIEGKTLHNMKYLISGGESLRRSSCIEFLEKFGKHIEIHNEYGPTETTVSCVDHIFSCDDNDDVVTIGSPINNAQIYIVDKRTNLLPIGVTGELCIAGDGVCAGYLNNPDLTNEKFIDNPFGLGKLYKTGDLAFWREDGNIVFVGRNDFQVKIRGLRIELGEIENAISAIDGVVQCAVVARQDEKARQFICAFYTGAATDAKDFRTILNTKLPKYMIPHIFTHLEEMPLTSSGKISRNTLPEIDLNSISTETEYVAPETTEEKILVKCIEDILGVENISVLDNFFDLGGDSLLSIELTSELENSGYIATVKSIFDAVDIQSLAKELTIKERTEEKIIYDSVLPVTAAQMSVYSTYLTSEEPTLYNIPSVFKVENLDTNKFEKAINKLIARHEGLRTSFENRDGEIVQIINNDISIKLELLESSNPNDFIKPFDLSKAPLLRVGYYENTIMVNFHHIIADGSTIALFYREINDLYMGRELPEPVQYGEFAVTSRYTKEDKNYWLNEYPDIPVLELYTDFPKSETQSFKGTNTFTKIDNKLNKNILDKCKDLGVTPYDFYMACYNILLSKYSGNEDICIGVPSSGRSSKYLNTWGMFVNTLSLRNQPIGTKTFKVFVNEVKNKSFEAISHQNYSQQELIKKLNYKKTLYDVMFIYQSEKMTHAVLGDKKAELLPVTISTSRTQLSFTILPREEDIVLMAEYRTDLFKEDTINKFICSYISILTQCLDSNKKIKDISVLTNEEKDLISSFNNTQSDYAKDKCICDLFEEQVEKASDKTALVANDKKLTYKELNEEANKLANSLIEKGIGKGDIVGVKLSRTSKFMVSVLGILKTSAAFLPFDPTHPQERIEQILSDSNAKLCITEENLNELLNNTNTQNPDVKIAGNDLCYCIYTSGSTGVPKGAMIQHKNLCWYMSSLMSIYGTDDINMPFFTSQGVDLSVTSIFFPLVTGGTTYFYDNDLLNDLSDVFNNEELNIIKLTPTHMQIIQQHINAKNLTNLKHMIVGGEQLYRSTCIDFLEKFGAHIKIHNEYGPTETTVGCGDYVFSYDDTSAAVSIGHPTNNVQMYIVDKHINLSPIGVTGELCISGDGVCAGYLNNEELTNEKFIDNPFGSDKLYKTGDLAYWREDGQIIYVGRNDFQVKVNGQRIELGEIENAIVNIDGVVQCAVVVREQYICAFYTGIETDTKDFRNILSTTLPRYMVPHVFTHLDSLPMTVSGKLDRKALPPIDFTAISSETEYVAPETKKEQALESALSTVLSVEKISMLDNFFNIGGDSINAIYVVSELEDAGYEIHVADIMQADTLKDIADAMISTADIDNYTQDEIDDFLPFSPIMRAYVKKNKTIEKNFVHTCVISADCDEETVIKAIDVITSHHDMLRGVFTIDGINVLSSDKRKPYSFQSIVIDNTNEAIEYLNKSGLPENKLVNVIYCKTAKENLICITVHHFLIDLISWEILMKDFTIVVNQLRHNMKPTLSAKSASFKLWNEELIKLAKTSENKAYWDNINCLLDNTKSFNASEDVNGPEEFSYTFSEDISNLLINEVNTAYGTRTHEVLITALGLAASKIADGSVGIMVESHGRIPLSKRIALEHTVGWFTSCYPVIVNNSENIAEELINTKDTIRRMPRSGIEYLLMSDGFHENSDIMFNFYKNSISNDSRENKLVSFGGTSIFPGIINVNGFVDGNILSIGITVPECKHKPNISEELGSEFVNQLHNIIKLCTGTDVVVKTRSDFSDDTLTESELDELMNLFDGEEI